MDATPTPVGGFVGPTPLLDDSRVYLNNPVSSSVVALNLTTGAIQWQTLVMTPAGKLSWGPSVLVKGNKLIQPVGPTLYTLNATTGEVLNQHNETPGAAPLSQCRQRSSTFLN